MPTAGAGASNSRDRTRTRRQSLRAVEEKNIALQRRVWELEGALNGLLVYAQTGKSRAKAITAALDALRNPTEST